jgi:3-phosphoshikimate 1-carboxyvinyltransferase
MAGNGSGVAAAAPSVKIQGAVRVPGDKSITHRALMLAGLARGKSIVRGALESGDARSTARVLRQLGVAVGALRAGRDVPVRGGPWRRSVTSLHCGNSGTTARLVLGLLAGQSFDARLTGDGSLRQRPMRRVTEPLRRMGARIVEERGDGLPLRIHGGPLSPLVWRLPVASAQVKSALLFAGLVGGVSVELDEPAKSRDHTERLLAALGAPLAERGTTVHLGEAAAWLSGLRDLELVVPGDASSAAFLVGAGVLAEGGELTLRDVGVNPTRIGFLRVLERMGASIAVASLRTVGGEPIGDLGVCPAALRAVEVTAHEIPSLIDEVPLLAVLASRAAGETVFRAVGELRVKESDRLGLLAANLRAVGAQAVVEGEDLVVVGSGKPPRGRVDTAGDHRLAMAFAVLGTVPGAAVRLSERTSPAVSYPGFFEDLRRIDARAPQRHRD